MLSCFFLNVCIKQKKNSFSLLIEKLEDEEKEVVCGYKLLTEDHRETLDCLPHRGG